MFESIPSTFSYLELWLICRIVPQLSFGKRQNATWTGEIHLHLEKEKNTHTCSVVNLKSSISGVYTFLDCGRVMWKYPDKSHMSTGSNMQTLHREASANDQAKKLPAQKAKL